MSALIAFSGACHSGKTSTIDAVKTNFPQCRVLTELIRNYNVNLAKLREDPNAYFDCEWSIINGKIDQENEVLTDCSDGLVLADRSLADSLYYLTRYTQVDKLTPSNVIRFYQLLERIIAESQARYSCIVFLKPIPAPENLQDPFRVTDLHKIQDSEAQSIFFLARKMAPTRQFSASQTDQIVEWINQVY